MLLPCSIGVGRSVGDCIASEVRGGSEGLRSLVQRKSQEHPGDSVSQHAAGWNTWRVALSSVDPLPSGDKRAPSGDKTFTSPGVPEINFGSNLT